MNDFIAFVASVLKTSPDSLSPETAYGSIPQWSSIMHLRLVMEIEDKYGIEIPIDEIPAIKTLSQFYTYIEMRK